MSDVEHLFIRRIDAFKLWHWRRLLRDPWTARRSNQSILKEISPGCSLEGLMLKLKVQYFWPPDVKSWLIWKDPDAGKDWGQEEKGTTEDEMVGWHNQLNGFGWTLGVGDGQGGLVCCSSWGRKESDTTERLNWIKVSWGKSGGFWTLRPGVVDTFQRPFVMTPIILTMGHCMGSQQPCLYSWSCPITHP